MGFSREEYWSGLPCPPPGDLPNPGTEPRSPALQADSLPSEPPGRGARISSPRLHPCYPVASQRSQPPSSLTLASGVCFLMCWALVTACRLSSSGAALQEQWEGLLTPVAPLVRSTGSREHGFQWLLHMTLVARQIRGWTCVLCIGRQILNH